ncbi:MAG: packaged DNA stabilization protein [Desulfobacterales bacterium]
MQIPILSGITTNEDSDFRTSYPRNYEPVPMDQGISSGYLRPADGIIQLGSGPGVDRGGINWNDVCYRVMGTKLVSIAADGTTTTLGDVGGTSQVTFNYSFDRLGIASNSNLFYWNGAVLTQVVDIDLGTVVDMIWVDGYFMTTDGEFLVVTELSDPTAVNPLKYGSSEIDPDPVVALKKLRNEVYAINRYTIESFQNIGGELFPFQVVDGAQMQRGSVGTHACAVFVDQIAFIGSGRNETNSIWLGINGQTSKLATREIDIILSGYTEEVLSTAILEERVTSAQQLLYVHLPDQTLVYNAVASQSAGVPVWYTLASSITGDSIYRARNFVRAYDLWLCGDPTTINHGFLTEGISSHYGNAVGWEFGTKIIYNEGRGAIFHELELVALSGRAALGDDPTIWTDSSSDGETWGQKRYIKAGTQGQRNKRLTWLGLGHMDHWRIQRFGGTSDAHLSFARLEAQLEQLNV